MSTKPVGGKVEVLLPFSLEDEWVKAKVIDLLASQFTARVGKSVYFFFYSDKGTTWRQIDAKA